VYTGAVNLFSGYLREKWLEATGGLCYNNNREMNYNQVRITGHKGNDKGNKHNVYTGCDSLFLYRMELQVLFGWNREVMTHEEKDLRYDKKSIVNVRISSFDGVCDIIS
jgi:hypothetical protein